jgi:HAD superfamily hydrolase (TIGR01459 family)
MTPLRLKDLSSILDDYDIFLFDIWGVIIEEDHIYTEAVRAINKLSDKKQIFFVSNSPRSFSAVHTSLKSWGIKTTPESIITSGEIASNLLINSLTMLNIAKPIIYYLGFDLNDDIINSSICKTTTHIEEANILLLTLYCYANEDLEQFDTLLKRAITLNLTIICANPDVFIPNHGKKKYGPGYFARKIESYGGVVIYTGKPHVEIYQNVFDRLTSDIEKNRILMVGDSLETDILGAKNVGIDSALVMSGNARQFHDNYQDVKDKLANLTLVTRNACIIPNFIINLD